VEGRRAECHAKDSGADQGGQVITVKLMGGAGNQLFQFAFGLAQATRLKTLLQVDTDRLGGTRPFCLRQWCLYAPVPTVSGLRPTILEQGMPYNQALVDSIKDGDVIQGYWQSEKYFESVSRLMRAMNQFALLSDRVKSLAEQIKNCNSVALHVRRGDYLNEPHKSFHGILTQDYYNDAINKVYESNSNLKFFLFSDDPVWVREHFNGENITVVQPGTEAGDIYLMSLCKHAIIANSSFSWWGAWLGDQQEGRTVIAPAKWFSDTSGEDYRDIVPERWIKI
jgi:hypothetical protein